MTWPVGWVKTKKWTWRLVFLTPHHWPQVSKFCIEIHSRIKQRKRKSGEKELARSKRRRRSSWGSIREMRRSSSLIDLQWQVKFFSKIHKSLNCFFDFYSSSKTFNFLEIRYPKFGIHSDIAEMTPVRPVFKPERNTSILVLAKVSVRYTWRKG